MSEPLYQIRRYGEKPGDFQLMNEWWWAHGQGQLPKAMLPPDGFILECDGEPQCAGWLYLSAGIGVAFFEWVVSKPGLGLKKSKRAFCHLIDFIRMHARECNYGVVWCNTLPSIARMARGTGFVVAPQEKVTMLMNTNLEASHGD